MDSFNNFECTQKVSEMIESCEDLMDLDEIIQHLSEQKRLWKEKAKEIFEPLVKKAGISKGLYSKTNLAKILGCSRPALNAWIDGTLPERDNLIRIGLVAGYDEDGINELLTKYGAYQSLYPKVLSDCVCLYVLHNYQQNRCERYVEIYHEFEDEIKKHSRMEEVEINTEYFGKQIEELQNEIELEHFIQANIGVFFNTYHRLYASVEAWLYGTEDGTHTGIFMDETLYKDSYISAIAEQQQWSASLKRAVSEIKNRKWVPTRMKIISLGIHLNMYRDDINELLRGAHMMELYSKNIFDAIVIYILESADLEGLYDSEQNDDFEPFGLLNYAYDVLDEFRDYAEIQQFRKEITRVEEDV